MFAHLHPYYIQLIHFPTYLLGICINCIVQGTRIKYFLVNMLPSLLSWHLIRFQNKSMENNVYILVYLYITFNLFTFLFYVYVT